MLGPESGPPSDEERELAEFEKLYSESSFGTPRNIHLQDQGRAIIRDNERSEIELFLKDVFPEGKPPKTEGKGNPPTPPKAK